MPILGHGSETAADTSGRELSLDEDEARVWIVLLIHVACENPFKKKSPLFSGCTQVLMSLGNRKIACLLLFLLCAG